MSAVRAWIGDSSAAPRLAPCPPRETRDDDVLLEMGLSAICGTDLVKLRRGGADGLVLGHELVGRVVGGPQELLGQRVVVAHHLGCGTCRWCRLDLEPHCPSYRENLLDPGGFAESLRIRHRTISGGALRILPSALDARAAVFFEPLACAVRALRRGGLLLAPELPRQVLICGAGGTGLLLLLATRALAPNSIVEVIEPRADRRCLASTLGAAEVAPALQPASSRRFDLVLDASGSAAALAASIEALAPGGSLVTFAHALGHDRLESSHHHLFAGERRILGSYSSGAPDRDTSWELLSSGRVDPRPLLELIVPFEQGAAAIEAALNGVVIKAAIEGSC